MVLDELGIYQSNNKILSCFTMIQFNVAGKFKVWNKVTVTIARLYLEPIQFCETKDADFRLHCSL